MFSFSLELSSEYKQSEEDVGTMAETWRGIEALGEREIMHLSEVHQKDKTLSTWAHVFPFTVGKCQIKHFTIIAFFQDDSKHLSSPTFP